MIKRILRPLFATLAFLVVMCFLVASLMMLYKLACWPLGKYLFPAIGMAALSIVAGLVAVWAAGSDRHWFVRAVIILATISPALLFHGSDMVLFLSAQALGIVVLMKWREYWPLRRARFRFTLADLLLFTTLLAVLLTVGTRIPRTVWDESAWIAWVGLLAGVPVAVLFGRPKEAGRSTSRFYRWIMRPLLFCAWPLGVCTGVAIIHFVFFPGTARPTVALPDPNGYDDLMLAARYLSTGVAPDVDEAMAAEWAGLPDTQSRALALARRGLGRECQVPLTYTKADVYGSEFQQIREVGRAFQAEGRLAEMEGRHTDALTSYLDLLRLAEASASGGLLIHEMVGWALSGMAIQGLASSSDSLDVAECRRVVAALEAYDACREPLESVVKHDFLWGEHASGKGSRYMYAIVGPSYWDSPMENAAGALHRNQMQLRLLTSHLALRQYRLEHGTEPDDLAGLVPEFLSCVPQDPYGNGPLVYRRTDTGFDLYSIGPDGVDDSGTPLVKEPVTLEFLGDVHQLEPAWHLPKPTTSSEESDEEEAPLESDSPEAR